MEKKIPDEDTVELEREDEDEDETLSLSDLPLIHKKEEATKKKGKENDQTVQEDFDFCSVSKQPEMCAADEVFFQGQILPLRHSVGSERGSLLSSQHSMVSRSESMDRFHSGTGGLISSRSSSISSSHQSSSSGSSSRPKLPPARNHFHSHPSPSPKIHFPGNNNNNNNNVRNYKKTSVWNVFRLGVLAPPPGIAFQDLKPRSIDSKRKKATNRSLIGGCTCSADAVETVVVINRSASESESEMDALGRVNNVEASPIMKKRAAKKHLSHHRTFEWLKQLSLEQANN